jgi:hypothetical protein
MIITKKEVKNMPRMDGTGPMGNILPQFFD